MTIKQATEQPTGQRRNQKRDLTIPETNKNGNTTYQNLQTATRVPRGKCIGINAYIKKKTENISNIQPNFSL